MHSKHSVVKKPLKDESRLFPP